MSIIYLWITLFYIIKYLKFYPNEIEHYWPFTKMNNFNTIFYSIYYIIFIILLYQHIIYTQGDSFYINWSIFKFGKIVFSETINTTIFANILVVL